MITLPSPITDTEIRQRAALNAEHAARKELEAEHEARTQAAKRAEYERMAARASEERRAIDDLAALKDLYAKRDAAAFDVLQAIVAFSSAEGEIRDRLAPLDRVIVQPGRDSHDTARRLAQLRSAAGLSERHNQLNLYIPPNTPARLAATTLQALIAGVIQPGMVRVGPASVSFEI